MSNKKRMYWNIVKAIGIISIVIGHSWASLGKFVYFYHLALFFFVGGALYNEKKYGNDPYLNFLSKIKNNWPKYVGFSIFLTLIHNTLFNYGLLENAVLYSPKSILAYCLNCIMFGCIEDMAAGLWFVSVYILSSTLFGSLVYFSNKVSSAIIKKKELCKNISLIILTIICSLLGLLLNEKMVNLAFHAQTVPLVIPFFTAGYYFSKRKSYVHSIIQAILFIISCGLLYYTYKNLSIYIDLSCNRVSNVYLFYIISFIGIYWCLYLSKIILNIKYIKNIFNKIGTYSFEIMALHFIIFKLIDYSYAKLNGIVDPNVYGVFPYAFKQLSLIYVFLGVALPTILFLAIDFLKKNGKDLFKKYHEIIMYLIFGILTTAISLIVYYALTLTILNPHNSICLQIANILSWIAGVLFAYFTNRKYVFESNSKNKLKEFSAFVGARITTLILDMIIMGVGVSLLHVNDKLLKIVSQILVIIVNYILSKLVIFNKKDIKNS